MTTKEYSKRQIIVSISTDNTSKFMSLSGEHIANINRALKNMKSKVIANFVYIDYQGLIIITNKVTSRM